MTFLGGCGIVPEKQPNKSAGDHRERRRATPRAVMPTVGSTDHHGNAMRLEIVP